MAVPAHLVFSAVDMFLRAAATQQKREEVNAQLTAHLASVDLQQRSMAHAERVLEIKTDLAKTIIAALIERRVDALLEGFRLVDDGFRAQEGHYLSEQSTISRERLQAGNTVVSADLRGRLAEIDISLDRIRQQRRKVYRDFSKALVLLGHTPLPPMMLEGTPRLLPG